VKDTCQLQNTIDYALDGSGQDISTKDQLNVRKSLMLTPLGPTDAFNRQRKDPLHQTLTDEKVKATRNATHFIAADLQAFVKEYCKINTTCPAIWGNPINATQNITNEVFFNDLIDRTKYVEPHNKMLPPKLCNTGALAPVSCAGNLDHHPRAELSLTGYHAYVDKYARALRLCAESGVQCTRFGTRAKCSLTGCTLPGKSFFYSPMSGLSHGATPLRISLPKPKRTMQILNFTMSRTPNLKQQKSLKWKSN
jgi:hypothetical protein